MDAPRHLKILNDVLDELRREPGYTRNATAGLSDIEIQSLEEYSGGRLPTAYVRFLKLFGRSAGSWLQGTDCTMGSRFGLQLREYAAEAIEKHTDDRLPDNAFVFLMHQGFVFAYFLMGHGDDPPVYTYVDGQGHVVETHTSFSEWVESQFADHVTIRDRITSRDAELK